MKQALETCVEYHEHDVFDNAYVPERLIDVRPEMPRLTLRQDHVPSHCSSGIKYTALSYCWGSGENQATTTAATLAGRQAGIIETELPLVVRDAIQVTRALGIPFLWIDALCILQDDPSDWNRQCTEMHNIYGSAQVTLCAANSRSCDEGILRQTGRTVRIPFQSNRIPDATGSFLILYKGLVSNFTPALVLGYLCSDTDGSRWDSRGWVFQEKVLSTQRLMFGARDLHFLCRKCHQRRGQDAVPRSHELQVGKASIQGNPKAIYEEWGDVLSAYSPYKTGSFTNPTDVLPALSGLAQLFHSRLNDDYYAGHWRRNLYQSLWWWQVGQHTHDGPFWRDSFSKPQSEAFTVPSWSRLDKGMTYGVSESFAHHTPELSDIQCEINVIKGRVFLNGSNPFGALTGCSLRLRGYTLDMNLEDVEVSEDVSHRNGIWDSRLLTVHGHHYGLLSFDCKPKLNDGGRKCVSEDEFGHFKLLLLMTCRFYVPVKTPTNPGSEGEFSSGGESSSETIPNPRHKIFGEFDGREDSKEMCWRHSSKEERIGGEEVPAPSDDSSEDSHSQQYSSQGSPSEICLKKENFDRKGLGLILCPTRNGGEFSRVGVFLSKIESGDIRELHSLAQVETVQLV